MISVVEDILNEGSSSSAGRLISSKTWNEVGPIRYVLNLWKKL